MAGYQKLNFLLKEELDELKEEGKKFDREEYLKKIEAAGDDKAKLMEIYDELCNLPQREDFKYVEPIEYEDILKESDSKEGILNTPDDETLNNKFYGAWLGRCAGCALGQPVELWNPQGVKTWFEKAGAWPIANYVPTHSKAEEEDNMKIGMLQSTAENIKFMPTDDDIRYTILGLILMQQKGSKFDTWDVGYHWMNRLPYRFLCTAETQAYLNFAGLDNHGLWGRPDTAADDVKTVKTYINPYREWIGAQIRIDAYGYGAACNPHLAAKMAFEDANLSHYKNGTYGAMFFAAVIAAAFSAKDIFEALNEGLKVVPKKSRFYEMAVETIEMSKNFKSQQELIDTITEKYKEYSYVHTINNAAICIAALVYGNGDFTKALTTAVACGLDTDCNGATVGSIMGALVGEKGISDTWKGPLNDVLYSQVCDYHPINISEVAKQTFDVYKKILAE